ncbi:UDP-glucuronosyltransferase 1A1-like isoform X3 [Octopus sinensis]|uniref:UDP-glucuronosyltransferase n=1 Tax=Octopus sinensis TaxID=2607531 RepID=A0A7E6F6N7_9MOLL|nr:UDP-glucuronosyltransferase 1A1-like isoform X3 [Octopus sinensis]
MQMKSDPNLLTFTEKGMQLLYKDSNVTFKQLQEIMDVICDNLLFDEDWFQSLKAVNATIAVIDYVFMSNCLAIIPYRLSIPYVFQGLNFQHYAISRTPWLPSTFPHQGLINSDKMNFYDRLENSFVTMSAYFRRLNGAPQKSVKTFAPQKPDITFTSLMQQADLYLIETDTVLDYPIPTLPNVVSIGGISTRPASALKGDLRKFVDESNHGIIVVSFGSFLEELPKEVIAKMELAFQEIKYSVVWKRPDAKQLAPNIFVTKWLPQNDLLGHPKTKLFITHCGINGLFEALYHGVPILGLPVFADQFQNGLQMHVKEYGISMDIYNYNKDELVSNINELIENSKYKTNIKLASEIFHSRPEHPAERAARYVDHVIKYGGDYLRSPSQNMPLYQFLMLDIYATFLAIIIAVVLVVKFVVSKCYRCCFAKKEKTE